MIAFTGEECWTPEDESFLQDHMDDRERRHEQKEAAIQFAKRMWDRYQETVTLLVDHPFGALRWEILYELPDSPDFFLCSCSNGHQQAFHSSELLIGSELTTRNNL